MKNKLKKRGWLLLLWLAITGWGTATAQERLFSYDFNNRTIREMIATIEAGSDYVFLFPEEVGNAIDRRATVSVKEVTITQLLGRILANSGLTFKIVGRQVLITAEARPDIPPLSENWIGGVVRDETGDPVPGASVVLKSNPLAGVSTDKYGAFSIRIRDRDDALIVSFIGMTPSEVPLSPEVNHYEVVLRTSVTELGNVIVSTGYFNRNKDNFTGSAIVIQGEELKKVNPNNLLRSIEAFDPSFRVMSDNYMGSNPNQLPNINVRGAALLPSGVDQAILRRDNISSQVNLPTFILDGYEVGIEKIYDLDMNRVASISLLKDAAATAIYGSRAANGVLVINTIAPKEGELRLSVNYEFNPSFADLGSYDVLNAREKLEYEKNAGVYDVPGLPVRPQQEHYYRKYYNVVSGVDTDWLAQPVRNALGNKISLFLEGGSATIRYGLSGLYQSMPGVMKKSGRDRISLGVDLSYNASNKLLFKNVLTVGQVKATDSPYGSFSDYVLMNPYYPKHNEQGEIMQCVETWIDRQASGAQVDRPVLNPLYNSTLSNFSRSKYREISDSFTLDWTILEGLRLRGLFSFSHKATTRDTFDSPLSNRFYHYPTEELPNRGEYVYGNTEENSVDAHTTFTYSLGIGGHYLNLALGANIRTRNTTGKSFTAIGFTNDRFTDIGFAKGYAENGSPSSTRERERLFGAFLSANYSYANRYLVDLSGRLDGSSKFGVNNRVAPFWAVGIGWNLHNEEFMIEQTLFSQIRIKGNFGLTGSVSFSPDVARLLYVYNKNNWYSTGVGASVSQYGNEDLKWQRTQNYDLGIDLGMFQNRIEATYRFYYKLTKDMVADVTLPASTGFDSYSDNLGDIKNYGHEVGIKAGIIKTGDWNVSLKANLVNNTNRVVKISNSLKKLNELADEAQTGNSGFLGVPLLQYEEGQAFGTIYAVRSLGIDPENGKEIFIKKDGSHTYVWDVKDKVPICDPAPTLEGYFGGSLYYRGFSVELSFYTRFGGYEYNQTLVDKVENADPRYNLDRRAQKHRWVNPGDRALYKDVKEHGTTQVTERFVQKDNLLELRSAYLSYDFQPGAARKLGMHTLRLSLTANDIFRLSTIEIERGITYPFARSFTFSLQSTF